MCKSLPSWAEAVGTVVPVGGQGQTELWARQYGTPGVAHIQCEHPEGRRAVGKNLAAISDIDVNNWDTPAEAEVPSKEAPWAFSEDIWREGRKTSHLWSFDSFLSLYAKQGLSLCL